MEAAISMIGPWRREGILGQGGNATVWRASRLDDSTPVALKVIDSTKVDDESYVRFIREVRFLRDQGEAPGILPLIDSHLPTRPSKRDRAWLAMPIATPIAEALEGLPLEGVVQAMATIANTLERLERELNVAHRDIKPGNLYRLDGEYLIGDFGLIALHDALPLTGNGRQVGPAHFTAYEMILDPSSADPHRADVYSLGKTLWVLATGQRFPPEGHQPVGMRKFEVGDFRPHPRSHALDQEVDLMTRLSPEGRPSKQQVARDLAAWVELTSEAPVIDVSEARMRLRAKIDRAMNAQDAEDQYKNLAHEAARRLQELVRPINDELRRLHPRTKTDVMNDKLTSNVLKRHEYPKRVIWDWRRCTIVAAFEGPMATTLRVARGLELLDDGTLHLYLTVHVGPEGTFGSDFHWSYRGVTTARVGSVEAELMLDIGVKELATAATQAVEIFVDRLPDLNGMN